MLVSLLLIPVCMSASAVGCKKKTTTDAPPPPDPGGPEEQITYTDDGAQRLMSFEAVEELLQSAAISAAQSKVELNDDARYISDGGKSAHMRMNQVKNTSGYYDNSLVQLLCNTKYLKKADFSDVEYLGLDIYNNSGFKVDFVLKASKWLILNRSTLDEGWNRIQIYLDRTTADFSKITVFDLDFKGGGADDKPLDVYVDNFRAYLTQTPAVQYVQDLSGENWYTFKNMREAYAMYDMGGFESVFSMPRMSINRNTDYILTGDASLKVEFCKKRNGAMDTSSVRTADNNLGDLNRYVGAENWYIAFDIYNATNEHIKLSSTVFSNYNDERYGISAQIAPHSWSNPAETRIYINDLKTNFTGEALNVLTVVFAFGLTSPGTVYIDSIRMAK
jgi:hypothetical protein